MEAVGGRQRSGASIHRWRNTDLGFPNLRTFASIGVVCSLLIPMLFSCSRDSPKPPRGIVMVCIDTLRADHLGAYGYARDTSPRIDALAREGILFQNAIAPSPWTLPSVATLMTAQYPSIHGAHSPSNLSNLDWLRRPEQYRPFTALHASRTTLAEVLRDAGFATYAAVQGSYPTRSFGFDQGFDVFHQNRTPGVRFDIEDALQWLDDERPDQFFLYLHVGEVHSPYTPIEMSSSADQIFEADRIPYFQDGIEQERARFESIDFDPDYRGDVDGSRESLAALRPRDGRVQKRDLEHLVALYDRGIAYTDYWIGELLDALSERGLRDEIVFVLTADHGEEFVEHGGLEHNYSYYDEMLRVPMIFRVAERSGVTVDSVVGLVDVMPTLLDILGLTEQTEPNQIQGRSLRPFWRDDVDPAESEYLGQASFHRGDVAIRTGSWKYIRREPTNTGEKARSELYDLEKDPGEQIDQCKRRRAICRAMARRLEQRNQELMDAAQRLALPAAEKADIDAKTYQQLRELGYVDGEEPAVTR